MNEIALTVDMQKDFITGKLPVKGALEIIPVINTLNLAAEQKGILRAYSLDSHPAVTSHFDKHPNHCEDGTEGAELHPDLYTRGGIFIYKGTLQDEDGYSVFDGHTLLGQSFDKILEINEIEKIVLYGVATDYCDISTVLDARKKRKGRNRYMVEVVADAIRAVNLHIEDEAMAIQAMILAGARFVTSRQVLERWDKAA